MNHAAVDGQLFVVPFAKSATTGQHCPVNSVPPKSSMLVLISVIQDNTRYAFLQMGDRALVYRGADQPDMSVINPEADVWQHIKVLRSLEGEGTLVYNIVPRFRSTTSPQIGLSDIRRLVPMVV